MTSPSIRIPTSIMIPITRVRAETLNSYKGMQNNYNRYVELDKIV